MNNNETKQSVTLGKMKIGESVVGYVKGFFKAPKSQTPDVDNIVLLTKDGQEVVVWASGTLRYFGERMQQKGAAIGTLTKITRIERPETVKATSRQKYFAEIGFKLDDVLPADKLDTRTTYQKRTDNEGFEY